VTSLHIVLFPDENVCCLIMEICNPEIKLEMQTASATSQCDTVMLFKLCDCCFWVHLLLSYFFDQTLWLLFILLVVLVWLLFESSIYFFGKPITMAE